MTMDSNGSVVGRQAHLPFGENFTETGTQDKYHFTTYERDEEAGLDYAVNRGYSSVLGKFQSADPYRASGYKVDPQSWNRYAYVRNDVINAVDPQGLLLCYRVRYEGPGGMFWSPFLCVDDEPGSGTGNTAGGEGDGAPLQYLLDALKNLSETCKEVFNKDRVKNWIDNVASTITFTDQSSESQIRGYPGRMTYNQYWQREPGAVALAVAVTNPAGIVERVLPQIITGAGYAIPALYASAVFWLFGGSQPKARGGILLHEFLHYAYQKDDINLARELRLDEKGYGDINSRNNASIAITTFLANNCKDNTKKQKKKFGE